MKKCSKKITTLLILILSSSVLPASAGVWDEPHKYTSKSSGNQILYIPGTEPITRITTTNKLGDADPCGFVSFGVGGKEKIVSIIVSDIERLASATTVSNKPKCEKQWDGSYKSEMGNLEIGTTFKTPTSYYVYRDDYTPIVVIREEKLNPKINACGQRVIRANWNGFIMDDFRVGEKLYLQNDIKEVKYRQICWGEGADNVKYTPSIYEFDN